MGKAVIILIVGLSVIIGIAASSIIGRTSDGQNSAVSAFNRTGARNVATSAAEYYVLQLKATPTLRGTFNIPSILGGSASVTLSDWAYGVTDSVRLTSIGVFSGTRDTTMACIAAGSDAPILNSAINFRTSSTDFKKSGTLEIKGYNHDINNNQLPASSDDRSGASGTNATDVATLNGVSEIVGSPDVILDGAIPDPSTFVAGLISAADYTYTVAPSGTQVWGSAVSPKIVYCNGDMKFTDPGTGWGILIINGAKFESTNKFSWTGLVVMYSGTTVEWKTSNTMTVVGGLLLSGPSQVKYNSTGKAYIHYSKAALALATTLFSGGGGALRVANWVR